MNVIQLLFICLSMVVLLFLIVDGFMTGSVWVKGTTKDEDNNDEWAKKRDRVEHPIAYWITISFYSSAFLFIAFLLVQEYLLA